MKINIYQIDAFSDQVFKGNPACVVPLKKWLPNSILLNIAKENAVAETAFFVMENDIIHLRWFTPDIEMDLCGHATLATAHCLKTILNFQSEEIKFKTLSGTISVFCNKNTYDLYLPIREAKTTKLPNIIQRSLSIQPIEILKSRDYLLIYKNQNEIEKLKIDRQIFDEINLKTGGVIVSSKGSDCDFVSRFFTPQATILEDPVTGSAHCSLAPYWGKLLSKDKMIAKQLSQRGGTIYCEMNQNNVIVSGNATTYLSGEIMINTNINKIK
jgi:PhzF family phenazine biosynthesis protein